MRAIVFDYIVSIAIAIISLFMVYPKLTVVGSLLLGEFVIDNIGTFNKRNKF